MTQIPRIVKNPGFLIIIILALSGLTHLWNAAGFPDVFFDEGVYMRRAMHVLSGGGPQEGYFYDHPFFGQIFLASLLGISGFPSALHPTASPSSISALYMEPRLIMGILAVADTYLIYKIASIRYGPKVGLVSSMLLAVMPYTWVLRRILLDSILLPFLLLSVYLALYSRDTKRQDLAVLLSGTCLGLAIFTKVLIFVLIPLIAGLVYSYEGKKTRRMLLFFIPVLLIPSLWPLYSMEAGQFNLWMHGISYQTERYNQGLPHISYLFLQMDPILFITGTAGAAYCMARRDWLVLMWFAPFVIFLLAIGYNQYFYWIPILPAFCIAGSVLIVKATEWVKSRGVKNPTTMAVLCIASVGLASTLLVITTDMSHTQYEAASYILRNVKAGDNGTTVLASPVYTWIFNYVFHMQNVPEDYSMVLFHPVTTSHVVLISDLHFRTDTRRGGQISQYNSSRTVASFDLYNPYDTRYYPYTNLNENWGGMDIKIKERQG
ncbi:MAG: glycosyltransferase family 39 protein [Thaumarchaeota archaeon]|nr:glycosyltransferase family 39 protein [Nitrososphaerota archaeon]